MPNIEENISFVIDYKKETVHFSSEINGKKKMSLNEFAISILKIEPISTEIIAMYIGKQSFESYSNNDTFSFIFDKKTRNGVKGKIRFIQ